MATNPKDAKFIADQEERAARAAEKRAQAEQDAMEYERLKLKDQGVSLDNYKKLLNYRRQQAIQEGIISDQQKKSSSQNKKTRDLAKDYSKLLKSNTGSLLSELNIMQDTNALNKGSLGAAKKAMDFQGRGTGFMEKRYAAEQEAFNLAQQARKEALEAIQQGSFDEISFGEDLEQQLDGLDGLTKKARKEIMDSSKGWAKETGEVIESAGGGEDFAKKMEMSQQAMTQMDDFKDKIFKVKSFITDPQFRKTLMKGFFIGLAVSAATKLGEAIKGAYDFSREMGISFKSMPIGIGVAKEEATALLDEFKTLEGVTTANLLNLKMQSYWYGVSATDSAKLLKLQVSTTDATKEMALKEQSKFMKELVKDGLSANKVIADMAQNTEFMAKFQKSGTKNMEEAAKAAAKMGISLETMSKVTESLLDYESSVNAEMELMAITGRGISLERARSLAYNKDIVGAVEEVKRQMGGEEAFANASVSAREAMAGAIGLSVAEMAEFNKAQEQSTEEQKKGADAIAMSAVYGIALGAVLGAIAVGFGAALWGAVTWFTGGAGAMAAIKGGMAGLGKGMAAGAGIGAIGGGIGGLGLGAVKQMERGGPVRAGNPYIVGEKRPELFVPSVSGNILPNVPRMAEGTGFVQGDMSQTNAKLDKLVGLMSARNDQAEIHSKKNARDLRSALGTN